MVSDRAEACPKCGCQIGDDVSAQHRSNHVAEDRSTKSKGKGGLYAIIGLLAIIIIGLGIYIFAGRDDGISPNDMNSGEFFGDSIDAAVDTAALYDAIDSNVKAEAGSTTNESTSNAEVYDEVDNEPKYSFQDNNLNGHYKMTGYMTDRNGDFPIKLSFDIKDGSMKNIVYKNVRFGGKIRMRCTSFDCDDYSIISFSINGKDGSKDFNIHLQACDNDTDYSGYANVGEKNLTVTLSI